MICRFRTPGRDARIGRRVAAARLAVGLTQAALPKRMGISLSMLSKLEIGDRRWTLEAITVVSEILQLPSDEMPKTNSPQHLPNVDDQQTSLDLTSLHKVDRCLIIALHALMRERAERLAA